VTAMLDILLVWFPPHKTVLINTHLECFFSVASLDLSGEQGCSDCHGVSWISELIQSWSRCLQVCASVPSTAVLRLALKLSKFHTL